MTEVYCDNIYCKSNVSNICGKMKIQLDGKAICLSCIKERL